MLKRLMTRFVIPALAAVGAVSLIVVVSTAAREASRQGMTAYACQWQLLSEKTCYPDPEPTAGGFLPLIEMAGRQVDIERQLADQLAPILAEQRKAQAALNQKEFNAELTELEKQKDAIVNCERDKLAAMQAGKGVSGWDCRKGTKFR